MEPVSIGTVVPRFIGALVIAAAISLVASPVAAADECEADDWETPILYDPHDLLWDTDVLLDPVTLSDVENLLDDYTGRIDEALDAEIDGLVPSDGIGSDELIDEARWEIEDAIETGRAIAGCED